MSRVELEQSSWKRLDKIGPLKKKGSSRIRLGLGPLSDVEMPHYAIFLPQKMNESNFKQHANCKNFALLFILGAKIMTY